MGVYSYPSKPGDPHGHYTLVLLPKSEADLGLGARGSHLARNSILDLHKNVVLNTTSKTATSAGLLHLIGWDCSAHSIALSQDIEIGCMEHSAVGRLYESLCENHDLDDGQPFLYYCYLLLRPDEDQRMYFFGDPYCLFDRICNVIAVVTARPVPMCRLMWSSDGFQTCERTDMLYEYGLQTDMLMEAGVNIVLTLAIVTPDCPHLLKHDS